MPTKITLNLKWSSLHDLSSGQDRNSPAQDAKKLVSFEAEEQESLWLIYTVNYCGYQWYTMDIHIKLLLDI